MDATGSLNYIKYLCVSNAALFFKKKKKRKADFFLMWHEQENSLIKTNMQQVWKEVVMLAKKIKKIKKREREIKNAEISVLIGEARVWVNM